MVQPPSKYLDGIIDQFRQAFAEAEIVVRDEQPNRSLLELQAPYGPYRIRLLEVIVAGSTRKYSYCVLRGDHVIVGFDNAPDSQALRLKYGKEFSRYRHERIPHRHSTGKSQVELTTELTCADFIAWVHANLALDRG